MKALFGLAAAYPLWWFTTEALHHLKRRDYLFAAFGFAFAATILVAVLSV
jgi:hypothetical protein